MTKFYKILPLRCSHFQSSPRNSSKQRASWARMLVFPLRDACIMKCSWENLHPRHSVAIIRHWGPEIVLKAGYVTLHNRQTIRETMLSNGHGWITHEYAWLHHVTGLTQNHKLKFIYKWTEIQLRRLLYFSTHPAKSLETEILHSKVLLLDLT